MSGVPDISTTPRRIRALVVDDSPDAAESLARLLEAMGCDASFVVDSARAMAAVMDHQPDIVFLDLKMPPPDGYVLARLIRSNYGRRIHTVALTGWVSSHDGEESGLSGFDARLLKPARPDLIESILKKLVPSAES